MPDRLALLGGADEPVVLLEAAELQPPLALAGAVCPQERCQIGGEIEGPQAGAVALYSR